MPSRRVSAISAASFGLVLACGGEPRQGPDGLSMEVQRIETLLELQWPYEILRIGSYLDGGSIGGALGDARSRQLLFSWDGGMRFRSEDVARMGTRHGRSAPVDSGPRLAYLGTDYPNKTGSRPVLVNSPEESALVDVLRLAATRSFPLSHHDSVAAIRSDLSPSSPWHQMWPKLSESQRDDLEAIGLATILSEQRAGRKLPRW
jgi:hypothetical protein